MDGFGGPFTPIGIETVNSTTSVELGLSPETEYCYRVRAVNGVGPSGYTGVVCATTFDPTVSVAHWTFDEGSGVTTADVSGNGHTGTLVNGASWRFTSGGVAWSLVAGIAGALGAFGVLMAFGAKGSPADADCLGRVR